MFEFKGLDDVNWHSLHHAYGSAEDVPGLLRELADATDKNSLDEISEKFFNNIQHQGGIYSATAATVPFLIQLLGKKDFLDRSWILGSLIGMLESCDGHVNYKTQISMLKDEFATVANIEREILKYLACLRDSDNTTRGYAVYLLMCINPKQPHIRLKLWQASKIETNLLIRAAMINSVGKLASRGYTHSAQRVGNQYRIRFQIMMRSAEEPIIRLAAVLAWIDSYHWLSGDLHITPPDVIPRILGESLIDGAIDVPVPRGMVGLFFSESQIVERLQRLKINEMIAALQIENMTGKAAHLIIREILDKAFGRIRANYSKTASDWYTQWRRYEAALFEAEDDQHFYAFQERTGALRHYYVANRSLNRFETLAIEAIVNCDPFWQIPTNLFSFFYGLPDSRDELRALLAKQD